MPAEKSTQPNTDPAPEPKSLAAQVFDDPESRRNLVGLFALLLKIDQRLNPQLYDKNKKGVKP